MCNRSLLFLNTISVYQKLKKPSRTRYFQDIVCLCPAWTERKTCEHFSNIKRVHPKVIYTDFRLLGTSGLKKDEGIHVIHYSWEKQRELLGQLFKCPLVFLSPLSHSVFNWTQNTALYFRRCNTTKKNTTKQQTHKTPNKQKPHHKKGKTKIKQPQTTTTKKQQIKPNK